MTRFGDTLAAMLKSKGITPYKLSQDSGVTHGMISRLIGGTRNPSRATVMDIADALALTPDETDRLRESAGFAPRSSPEVDRFRKLSPDVQRAALDLIERVMVQA